MPADIDESVAAGETRSTYVRRLALEKADGRRRVRRRCVVIAADTTVDLDGEILGKPDDDDEAGAMLRSLSGRTHRVHTGGRRAPARSDGAEVVTTVGDVHRADRRR